MFINISELSDKSERQARGSEFSFSLDLSDSTTDEASRLVEALAGINIVANPNIEGNLDIDKNKDVLSVKGHIKATVGINCSRCLKDLKKEIEKDFSDTFLIKEFDDSLEGEEVEISSKELSSDYIASGNIDTNNFFIEQIATALPLHVLCDSNCKGLCLKCGADLNSSQCDCIFEETTDPRFAGLKDFKIK